jgi:hypothetical protein
LTSIETLRRIAAILERLSAGATPDGHALADAPLAESWSVISAEDIDRIGPLVSTPPQRRRRPCIGPLLAIDGQEKWALVLVDNEVRWWVLGEMLPGAAPEDGAETIGRAAGWVRRWLQ